MVERTSLAHFIFGKTKNMDNLCIYLILLTTSATFEEPKLCKKKYAEIIKDYTSDPNSK